jgi:hypothetical protein
MSEKRIGLSGMARRRNLRLIQPWVENLDAHRQGDENDGFSESNAPDSCVRSRRITDHAAPPGLAADMTMEARPTLARTKRPRPSMIGSCPWGMR